MTIATINKACDITLIIPVKDRFEELLQTLASVYAQTLLPRELIIVDDCSSVPVTMELLGVYPSEISFVILRNDPNLGGAGSLNRATWAATQPVLAFLDSDDCLLPDYMEAVSDAWKKASPDTVCIAAGFFWCTDNLVPYQKQCITYEVTHQTLLTKGNVVGGSSCMSVRRDALKSVGGHPACRGSHDWGMLLRISAIGKIQMIAKPLMLYRSPSTNPRPNYTKNYRKQIIAIGYIYKILSPEDRVIIRPRIRKLVLNYIAKMGRRRMAIRLLRSELSHEKIMSKELLHPLFILVFGTKAYDTFLLRYALLRARLFGKRLLASYGQP
jgi:glycosyltransferase involved in cell wall biosynthesis